MSFESTTCMVYLLLLWFQDAIEKYVTKGSRQLLCKYITKKIESWRNKGDITKDGEQNINVLGCRNYTYISCHLKK